MPRAMQSRLPESGELFERYGAMVFRRCREMLRLDHEAADAVQEVFLRTHERRESFRGDATPATWLYAVATLHCLQRLRNQKRRHAKLEAASVDRVDLWPPSEDHLTLLQLLDGQNDEVRLMIYLRYVDGLTLEEVAQIAGCSRRTVSERVQAFVVAARLHLELPGETT